MSPIHHESAFGDAIVASLLAGGWERGDTADYRPDLGLDTHQLFTFIGATQAAEWEDLVTSYGGDRDATQRGFVKRLDQAIATDGLLDVLRKGVKDHGVRIRVAYFKPSFVESDEILADYRRNRLTVVRELAYATKQADRGNRLDLALFLNGIPVATAELKNPLTGSGVEHAKEQYRTERDPTELIFSRRVIANFALTRTWSSSPPSCAASRPGSCRSTPVRRARVGRAARVTRRPRSTGSTPPPTCGRRSGSGTTGSTCWSASFTCTRRRVRMGALESR